MVPVKSILRKIASRFVHTFVRIATSPRTAYLIGEPLFLAFGFRRNSFALSLGMVKRILVVRLDEIGDVVLLAPFLRELRHNAPYAWIGLVVKPAVFNLVELCPNVDQVLTFDLQTADCRWPRLTGHWRGLKFGWQHGWGRPIDLAISPRQTADAARGLFLMYFSGARWRAAFSETATDGSTASIKRENKLLTHPFHCTGGQHEVEKSLEVLSHLGSRAKSSTLELWTSEQDQQFAADVFSKNNLTKVMNIIALGIGAGCPNRVWPADRFAELAKWLEQNLQARLIVIGGGSEIKAAELIQQSSHAISMTGKTTLRQTAAVLERCTLFIGNDSGPMHLAAAAGVPVVEISCHPRNGLLDHPRSPVRFSPWQVPTVILQPEHALGSCCGFCAASAPHCITQIQVENVTDAVITLLGKQM